MKCEIQIHFENCGQLQWTEDIKDIDSFLAKIWSTNKFIAHDSSTSRYYGFDMKRVNAVIVTDKSKEQPDIWSRTYATSQGKVEEGNQQQHQGNDGKWPPTASSGRCCA